MVNAIFCAHGKLACAMLESVQMVYGNANVEAVEFVPGENAGDIVAKLEKLVSIHNQDEWLIAVDLQCGSPWNAAAMLAMRNPRLRVISGLSDAPRDKRTYFREINYIAAAFQYQKKNYNSA